MSDHRALDPESDFIVVRSSKDGGRHAHVMLKDLDRLFETIGQSARAVESMPAPQDPALAQEVEQIKRRQEGQERALQALADGLDSVARKMNAIFEIAAETAKGRAA